MRYSLVLVLLVSMLGYSQVSVRGYYRKDGTYVRPHERTYPNSTVTDNYSYPGNYNPNLEYNPPLKSSSSRSYSSTSSSSYPSTSSSSYSSTSRSSYPSTSSSSYSNTSRSSYPSTSSSSYSNTSSSSYPSASSSSYSDISSISTNVEAYLSSVDIPSRVRYITSDYVNVRSEPMASDYNTIGVLDKNSKVILVENFGKWSKVVVLDGDDFRYAYIASALLSRTDSKVSSYNSNDYTCETYYVVSDRTYFYNSPDLSTKRSGYLIQGEKVCKQGEQYGFIYVEFVNARNQTSKGWLLKSDLYKY